MRKPAREREKEKGAQTETASQKEKGAQIKQTQNHTDRNTNNKQNDKLYTHTNNTTTILMKTIKRTKCS